MANLDERESWTILAPLAVAIAGVDAADASRAEPDEQERVLRIEDTLELPAELLQFYLREPAAEY